MASLPPTPSADSRTRVSALRQALATRVVVADGAMGTMLQAQDPTLEDFQNLEGCNEILNVTRPDIVRSVHEAYFAQACLPRGVHVGLDDRFHLAREKGMKVESRLNRNVMRHGHRRRTPSRPS